VGKRVGNSWKQLYMSLGRCSNETRRVEGVLEHEGSKWSQLSLVSQKWTPKIGNGSRSMSVSYDVSQGAHEARDVENEGIEGV